MTWDHSMSRQAIRDKKRNVDTYVPTDRTGWWGGPDERERCVMHDKVVLTEVGAAKVVVRTEMESYIGDCGHLHVGHGKYY